MKTGYHHLTVVLALIFNLLFLVDDASAQQHHQLDGVIMSGSGVAGLGTRNISLLNPDTTQLNQVSVTPHFWVSGSQGGGTSTNTDTLDGLVRGSGHGYTSSWNPSLSPSGRMVFATNWFYTPGGGSYHLVAQNRDATDRVIIAGPFSTGSGASDRALRPSISPDGKNVIYTVSEGVIGQLFTVPSDGSEEPRLFEITMPEELSNRCRPDHIVQAVYSPDGGEIAFLGITEGGSQHASLPAVCVMNADGTNLRVLYADDFFGYEGWHQSTMVIDWKADRILFAKASSAIWGQPLGSRYQLKIIDAENGAEVHSRPMVGPTGTNVVHSSYQLSPDGRYVAYASQPAECWIHIEHIETEEIVFDLTGRLDTGPYCYLNWSAADPVPRPARLELSEQEVVLWKDQTAVITPTLYDEHDNVIVHEARSYSGGVQSLQIRVNRFTHTYYGYDGNVNNLQHCAFNAGFEACVTLWNAQSPLFFISAPVDTVFEGGNQTGLFRIHRIGNPRQVSVRLSQSLSARIFRDYVLDHPSLFLFFEEGVYERHIRLTPIDNGLVTGDLTARMSIQSAPDYRVSWDNNADITIIDNGISASDLSISGVSPQRGTDRGTAELRVLGRGMEPGSRIFLERGGTRIEATNYTSDQQTLLRSLSGKLDLRGQPTGFWDVVVETPGGASDVLPDAFEIITSENPFSIVSGVYGYPFVTIRNMGHNHHIRITNTGDNDVYDVLAFVWLSRGINATIIDVPDIEFDDPEFNIDEPQFIDRGDFQIAPIWIYRLPAQDTKELRVHVQVPAELLGQQMVLGVTHWLPDPEEDFSWTGIFDEVEERLPWNIGVLLGMMQKAALEFDENVMQSIKNGGTGEIMVCPPPPSPPSDGGCGDTGSGAGFTGNQADDAWNLHLQLENDRARMFNAVTKSAEFGAGQSVIALSKMIGGRVGECIAKHVVHRVTGMSSSSDFASAIGFGDGGGGGQGGGENCSDVVSSWDPNDKLGLSGIGEGRYIRELAEFPYQIRFENVDSATAPAQIVIITDTLDTNVFDINTFRLGAIEVAEEVVAMPPFGATSFTTTVDLRPEKDMRLHISAQLERNDDENFARVQWILTTLMPTRDELPENPMTGFLPPNVTEPEGEGSVRFYISPFQNLPDGTRISNHAEIVFDSNPAIVTPVWTNTVDLSPPGSEVMLVEATDTAGVYQVTWDGSDAGSGIRSYGIFVQKDDGPFELWKESRETSGIFRGEHDTHYGFFAMAIDRVGNVEPGKTKAEAFTPGTVSVSESDLPRVFALHANYPNPFNPVTVIPFDLPEDAYVRLSVYDVLGRRVQTLVSADMQAGRHALNFDAARLSSGTYLVRMQAGSFTSTRKIMLVK